MSFVSQVRSKLPSPKASAFLATVGTLVGLKVYDKHECQTIQARLKEQARVKADEPMAVTEKPRRVEVYFVPPPGDGLYKPVEYFERWVKPIWDAAAMEYDLIKCKHAGEAHHMAREAVKWRRRHEQAQPLLASAFGDDKPGTPVATPPPNVLASDGALPHGFTLEELARTALQSMPASMLVAIGPLAYTEMVNGATEGCAVIDTRKEPFVSPEEERKQRAKDVGLSEQELKLIEEEETLDMIPYEHRIGWSTIPGRMVRWFYQRRLAAAIGAEALRVALEETRPLPAHGMASMEGDVAQ
ncbi:inner membrane protein import complex subunit Tim54-domain-containing protein [Syncephalis pseudoplumigaleata]|uniref:Mitochondrial import inner membrane translocase subunit TIM54 n=1 Tax=Syncephalis pseudoplumigaleata TaxID=1712513 RepID=A0A4P9Z6I2_9FUNG|nr:inner membrane protein import complex subunit Tim54-domain-containing protein [Syncephalis pseudoplumigaleata]|eukprot:RKP28058.1 inner membrane protein import complex subunit Tim54-domain-containing protein [Syncephalis pseudoplumigaleata]